MWVPVAVWQSCELLYTCYLLIYYATDQCRKILEPCINAEGGHSEHLLWHCLPDIPVATHHNRFFLEPLMTTHNWFFSEPPAFWRTQRTFSLMKKFSNSQVSVVTFSGGWASKLQFVFVWDNKNNQKHVWIIMLKNDFLGFPKIKWLHPTGEMDKSLLHSCQIFSGFNTPKIINIG